MEFVFSEEVMETLSQKSEQAISRLSNNEPIGDILADIYCELPDKNKEIGQIMADRVLELVDEYEQSKTKALEDEDTWIAEEIDSLLEGKDQLERCTKMYQLLLGFTALNDSENAEDILSEAKPFNTALVDDTFEHELREKLLQSIKSSTFCYDQLLFLVNSMDDIEARDIVDFGKNDREVKAILCMIAYVNGKNCTIDGIPPETTLDTLVPSVCFGADAYHTAQLAGAGKISEENASKILRVLGIVAGTLLTFKICTAAASLIPFTPALLAIAAIPVLMGVTFILTKVVSDVACDICTGALELGWRILKGAAKMVYNGVKTILSWFTAHNASENEEAWEDVENWIDEVSEAAPVEDINAQQHVSVPEV